MRLSILAAITATALSVSTTAHAEQWWFTEAGRKHAELVELDSITKNALGTRRIWVAHVFSSPIPDLGEKDAYVLRTLFEMDCADNRWRSLQSAVLTKDLQSKNEHTVSNPQWKFAAPGTRALTALETACGEPDTSKMVGPWSDLRTAMQFYYDKAASLD